MKDASSTAWTGWHPEEAGRRMPDMFDIVIDCTNGNGNLGHGSVGEAIEIKNRMLAEFAAINTQFVVNLA